MKHILIKLTNKLVLRFNDKIQVKYKYYKRTKRYLNFKNPKTFNEKIICRMLQPMPIYSILSDKIAVREYIKQKVGEKYVVPLYGVYDEITYEDLEKLPDSFVLKANHGCGFNEIVHDKTRIDADRLINTANSWLNLDYSLFNKEKQYARIKRKLLAEELLLKNNKLPEDFKVDVLDNGKHGEPFIFITVIKDRNADAKSYSFSEDWTETPFQIVGIGQNNKDGLDEKPDNLEEMIWLAKRLADGFSHCRVDMYLINDQIYVGELTFTPKAGNRKIVPPEYDIKLGQKFGWPENRVSINDLINIEEAEYIFNNYYEK